MARCYICDTVFQPELEVDNQRRKYDICGKCNQEITDVMLEYEYDEENREVQRKKELDKKPKYGTIRV